MPRKTPEQIADKYQRGVAGAGQDYLNGVQAPSRPWAAATVASAQRWQTGIQQAISDNKFQRGVQAAGDAKWQTRAADIGAQRYTQAATTAAAAYAQIAARIMAAGSAASQAAGAMPNATQDQRIQRAVAAMKATSQYWKSR